MAKRKPLTPLEERVEVRLLVASSDRGGDRWRGSGGREFLPALRATLPCPAGGDDPWTYPGTASVSARDGFGFPWEKSSPAKGNGVDSLPFGH